MGLTGVQYFGSRAGAQQLRILQVTPAYFPEIGGVQSHVQAISERLAARGHHVQVAAMSPENEQSSEDMVNGIPVRRFHGIGVKQAYRVPVGFAAYLAEMQPDFDIVHVHNYHASMIPIAAAIAPDKLIVTPHLNDQPHSAFARLLHTPYGVVGRWSLARAQAVICVSRGERTRVRARLGVPPEKIVVIPNGVDRRTWTMADPAPQRDPGLLLAVGRLEPYKRVEDAIAALASLPGLYRLVVIGQGSHRAALESAASDQGVAGRVSFLGRVPNDALARWYREAEVVLNLSTAEAFGMTVLEAVAGGSRVVCRNIPAFADLARQFPGYITTVDDAGPEGLAAAIVATAEQAPPLPADLRRFTWEAIAAEVENVYLRCRRTRAGALIPQTGPLQAPSNAK